MTDANHKAPISTGDRIRALLMGTAAGDAMGLPAEGMPAARIMKIYKGHWRHRLLPGLGVISDDTDHTFMTAHCLHRHPQSPEGFRQELARCLRLWLATLPAGVGLATLKSIMRLWMGRGSSRSGVHSAGNGPAMRTAIIGAFHHSNPTLLADCVRACTTITHTDPKALTGAMAVALTAGAIVGKWGDAPPEIDEFCTLLLDIEGSDEQWKGLVRSIRQSLEDGIGVREFSALWGSPAGVSGYVYHTVPVALYAWRRHHGDYRTTVESVLTLGGDTDTVAAIAGALAGAATGPDAIPRKWVTHTIGWPVTIQRINTLANGLASDLDTRQPSAPLGLWFFACMGIRNLLVLPVILLHALRRLLPPY